MRKKNSLENLKNAKHYADICTRFLRSINKNDTANYISDSTITSARFQEIRHTLISLDSCGKTSNWSLVDIKEFIPKENKQIVELTLECERRLIKEHFSFKIKKTSETLIDVNIQALPCQ